MFKQSLSVHDMTPAMRNPPARRLEKRGRRGWWPRFPSSPQDPHDRLLALLGLDRLFASSATISWDATNDLAGDLDAAAGLWRICGWPTATAPGRWPCAGRC